MRSLIKRRTLEDRVRDLEFKVLYPTVEDLTAAIERAVKLAAMEEVVECGGSPTDRSAEKELIALVRYAGRSGLLRE